MIFEDKTPEYFERVQSLQFLTNKEDFMSEDSFIIKNGLTTIIPFIEKDGYRYHIHPEGYYMIIYLKDKHIRTIYHCDYGINDNPVTHRIFDNKTICSYILSLNNIPTLDELTIYGEDHKFYRPKIHNVKYISNYCDEKLGYPCIIKPIDQSRGRGIIKIHTKDELLKYINKYHSEGKKYILQKYHDGKDFRIIYLNGEVLKAYERKHPIIVGNSNDTIQTLIENTGAYLHDPEGVSVFIDSQGFNMSDVLKTDVVLKILPTANITSGGSISTDYIISNADLEFVEKIAKAIGSNYFGLDVLTHNFIHEGIVLEINKMPGTDGIGQYDNNFLKLFGSKIRSTIKQSEGIID